MKKNFRFILMALICITLANVYSNKVYATQSGNNEDPITITISYYTDGGNPLEFLGKVVTYGEEIGALPSPTKKGYTFNGWYTAQSGGELITETTIVDFTEFTYLYAHWLPKEDEAAEEGEFGESLYWEYYGDGRLYIRGEGAMPDYNGTDNISPWYHLCTSIKKIIIENGVTSIGDWAFEYCIHVNSATIPSTVEKIGEYAFWDNYELTHIDIPDSVTVIESKAFLGCTGLQDFNFPPNITEISDFVLGECAIKNIVIPDGVTSIGEAAFSNETRLESVSIPEGVTSIGANVFYNCSSLNNVILPNSAINIDNKAFARYSGNVSLSCKDCYNLTSLKQQAPNAVFTQRDHDYPSGEYEIDAEGKHYQVCSVCNNQSTHEAHSGGIATCDAKAICEFCGVEYGELSNEHSYETSWSTNENRHWHSAICSHTGEKSDEGVHSWTDGKCSVCGYECKHPRIDSNENCTICGKKIQEENEHNDQTYNEEGNNTENSIDELRDLLKQAAARGAGKTIYWNWGTSLPYDVMRTLQDNVNLTLNFKYTYMGVSYDVTIPGSAVSTNVNVKWYGPLNLYGTYRIYSTKKTATMTKQIKQQAFGTYTVKKGDSLSKIARNFNTTIQHLIEVNNIQDRNKIREGQILKY